MTDVQPLVRSATEGLRLHSGPGRDLVFKVTGDDTANAFDYFTVDIAPHDGPPLHVHHNQDETIHVLRGRYKVQVGEEIHFVEEGGFAFLPKGIPHTFLNLTGEMGEIIVVYVPGGGQKFYEEFGVVSRDPKSDRKAIADVFTRHAMTLLGGKLTRD